MTTSAIGLYDPARESSACGVGFLTRKDGRQDHDVIVRGELALCAIPHRGGMSSEGVGDGAGVSIDLSVRFFSELTGRPLQRRDLRGRPTCSCPPTPRTPTRVGPWSARPWSGKGWRCCWSARCRWTRRPCGRLRWPTSCRSCSGSSSPPPLPRWTAPTSTGRPTRPCWRSRQSAYERPELAGLYPLSLSARTQVLKGRLNAGEVVRYFTRPDRHRGTRCAPSTSTPASPPTPSRTRRWRSRSG